MSPRHGSKAGGLGHGGAGARILFLEAVRGLAALIVLIQHLCAVYIPAFDEWSRTHVDLGRVGVVAFFLVSGYVIPLSLAGQGIGQFAVRRFFRLYPVFWLGLGAYVFATADSAVDRVSALTLVLNLLMLQGLFGATSILPPSWTLGIELLFYVQSAMAKRFGLLDRSVQAGWLWLGLYLALDVGERVLGRDLPGTLPLLLFTASLGHALHLRDKSGGRTWAALLIAAIVVVPLGAAVAVDGGGAVGWSGIVYSSSYFGGLVLFGTFYCLRRRRTPASLVWLGGVSYALYLLHPIFSDAVRLSPSPALTIVLSLAVTLALGWCVHVLVEKPSIRIGRRLTSGRKEGVDADALAAP